MGTVSGCLRVRGIRRVVSAFGAGCCAAASSDTPTSIAAIARAANMPLPLCRLFPVIYRLFPDFYPARVAEFAIYPVVFNPHICVVDFFLNPLVDHFLFGGILIHSLDYLVVVG